LGLLFICGLDTVLCLHGTPRKTGRGNQSGNGLQFFDVLQCVEEKVAKGVPVSEGVPGMRRPDPSFCTDFR
jgi:hypothetical protein